MTLRRRPAGRAVVRAPRPATVRGIGRSGQVRRTRTIRRASAGLTPTRAAALLVMLGAAAATYGMTASSAFAGRSVSIEGTDWTSRERVLGVLDLDPTANLFTLRTGDLAARLTTLPTVRSATVDVALPDALRVAIVERVPLLVWQVGERRLLVDGEGRLFLELAAGAEAVDADGATLPQILDERAASHGLREGGRLDPVDLDAATRLGSLKPADVGSSAPKLDLRITEDLGYVMRSGPKGWVAVFGHYTPMLRTPELIPGQVRLLRSLIIGREPTVQRVILADDRNGTFVPRPTPKPSATTAP